MALADDLLALAAALDTFAKAADRTITLTIETRADGSMDAALADGLRRGQMPQTVDALKKKLG